MPHNRHRTFQHLQRLRSRLRKLVDNAFHESTHRRQSSQWTPPADIHATGRGVKIKIDVPGISAADVDVAVDGNTVIVTGSRDSSAIDPDERFLHSERSTGTFRRSFSLNFEPTKVQKQLEGGVLTINVQRQASTR